MKGGVMKTRIKLRIPVAPPSRRHRSKKDYDRKEVRKVVREIMKRYKEVIDELA